MTIEPENPRDPALPGVEPDPRLHKLTPRAPSAAESTASGAASIPRRLPGAGTPMFRQYLDAKRDHPDAILLFRMGDFYEMFFEDALLASKALDLTLTSRGRGTAAEAPMCGVPVQAVEGYIARLVGLGHRVAVCEQTEDPRSAKGLVRREVIRVVSPGTLTDPANLDARAAVYVAAVAAARGPGTGLALADLSTGEFLVWEGDATRAREILLSYAPREIIHAEETESARDLLGEPATGILLSPRPGWIFAEETARRMLEDHFGVVTLDGFGLAGRPLAVGAGGALLGFLKESQKAPLTHIESLRFLDTARCLMIDPTTRRNLELVRGIGDQGGRATLIGVLDQTLTAMGARGLRDWLTRPLVERGAIEARLETVAELQEDRARREAIREILRPVPDLERLAGRIAIGAANARDLVAVRRALAALPPLRSRLCELRSMLARAIADRIEDLSELSGLLARALADDPPVSLRDGDLIRSGFDADVDRWRAARRTARTTLADLEARERKRTGIGNLKVRYNKVFGYYIEVSKSNLSSVPDDYVRKQTLVGGERYVTPELKDFEDTLLAAETELYDREYRLFCDVLAGASAALPAIRRCAGALAEVDVLCGFAEASERYGYTRPTLSDERVLKIVAGRHPVVERLGGERFIPNDLTMDSASAQVIILTGPNMGGKSTYLRQTALIVLMAQAGCFVPAESAEIGVADRIFCRVGSSDNLAGGQSTFLVEMSETANILHSASSRSLVLLDEIGRGTATFDGLSIAWAVAEWLHENPSSRPRTLFATHYHELTELALLFPRVKNLHISAREYNDTVLFLRRVEEGPADRSYGIQVARLAGLPREVITRAREVLENLERNEFGRDGLPSLARRAGETARGGQLPLFVPAADPFAETLLDEIRDLDPNDLTPLRALTLITGWKEKLEPPGPSTPSAASRERAIRPVRADPPSEGS